MIAIDGFVAEVLELLLNLDEFAGELCEVGCWRSNHFYQLLAHTLAKELYSLVLDQTE